MRDHISDTVTNYHIQQGRIGKENVCHIYTTVAGTLYSFTKNITSAKILSISILCMVHECENGSKKALNPILVLLDTCQIEVI